MFVCVVGNFGASHSITDGQSIKTAELYDALVKQYGEKEVCKVNLFHRNKALLAWELMVNLARSDNVIVLVSVNGRKTVIPLLAAYNVVFKKRIFHSLIGSTTHITLQEYPWLLGCYKSLAGNWTETSIEKENLEALGLRNVSVVKNFKSVKVLSEEALCYSRGEPYRLCTFSRVEEKKGITDIVRAVNAVNQKYGRTVFTLDIYGKVEEAYIAAFDALKEEFGQNIRYMGVVDYNKSVETIKRYYMLVFPTKYFTEGIPGTILDAFSAGVPVLSAQWGACADIITPETGITYPFDDTDALLDVLEYARENVEMINGMKKKCLAEARKYAPEEVVKTIGCYLKGDKNENRVADL